MNQAIRWVVAGVAVAVFAGCTDIQEPPSTTPTPVPDGCGDDSVVVTLPRWVGDSLFYYTDTVPPWEYDSLVVRAILDFNNLPGVSYYQVTEVDSCGRVTELDLSALSIRSLWSKVADLTELRRLLVYNNYLDSLPSSIGELPKLHTLKAQRCGLDFVPESLCRIDSLRVLYLFDNDLVGLPDSIGRLPELTELKLTDNDLDSLPLSIMDLPSLSEGALTVTRNHLCTVSDDMAAWLDSMSYEGPGWRATQEGCDSTAADTSAVRRALDGAGLTAVSVGEVASVRAGRIVTVDLSQRGLSEIPIELFSLTALEYLDVSGNSILALPTSIYRWGRLRELHIPDNALSSNTVASMDVLDSLRILDMAGNYLTEIPQGLDGLDSTLEVLDLSGNALDTLALIGWDAPSSLERLDVSDNKLRRLATSIGGLRLLRELDASRNALDALPPLDGLMALETLRAAHNALTGLPALGSLTTLRTLDVSSNSIDSLPPSIGDVVQLDTLDLRTNRLDNLPLEIAALQDIEQVWVAGNLLCDTRETVDAWLTLHAEPGWDTLQECTAP